MTPPTDNPYFGRRESDHLVDHRLDKLESIVEKLAENQTILTRIELNGQENSRALAECKSRLDRHGATLDIVTVDVQAAKTLLDSFPEVKEYATLSEKVSMHDRAIVATISLVCLGGLGKFLGLI